MARTRSPLPRLPDDSGEGLADRAQLLTGALRDGEEAPSTWSGRGFTWNRPVATEISAAPVFERAPAVEVAPVAASGVSPVTWAPAPVSPVAWGRSVPAQPLSYGGGTSWLSSLLGAATTISGEVRTWAQLSGNQQLQRAKLSADTTVELARINAAVRVGQLPYTYSGGGGGLALGSLAQYLPWLVLLFGAAMAFKMIAGRR